LEGRKVPPPKKQEKIEKIVFHYKNNGFGPKIDENALKT